MCVMSFCADAPPAYTSSVGYPVMPQQQQQTSAPQTAYYSSPAFPAAAAPPPSVYDGGDAPLPTKA